MDCAVRIKNFSKVFKLYSSPMRRIVDAVFGTRGYKEFVALDDLTVDLPKGEVIGILGKNGSGKSTLLKIITGVMQPSSGSVETDGRIAAMLELTAGFDQELTGIENIYLKALSMGISREDISRRLDDIIAFADIGDHINDPVRTYSSGMKSRLGFAVSVNVDPDILVVDEVLAVGDDVFRLKCIEKMKQFRAMGKTILFVSHSLFTVKAFCTKGMWLCGGKLMAYGELGDVVKKYEAYLKAEKAKTIADRRLSGDNSPVEKSDIIEIKNFAMLNEVGEKASCFACGEDISLRFDYTVKRPIDKLNFGVTLRDGEKREIFMSPRRNAEHLLDGSVGTHSLEITIKHPNLLDGEYYLSGEMWDNDSTFYVGYANKRPFSMVSEDYRGSGICSFDIEFKNV